VIRRLHKADEARVLQKLASGAAVDVRVLRNVLRRRAIYESDSIQHLEKRFDLYRLVAQRGFLIFRGGLRHQAHYPPQYLVWFQADYGIFYAGKFVKESQPGHNLTYWALWTGYKFYGGSLSGTPVSWAGLV